MCGEKLTPLHGSEGGISTVVTGIVTILVIFTIALSLIAVVQYVGGWNAERVKTSEEARLKLLEHLESDMITQDASNFVFSVSNTGDVGVDIVALMRSYNGVLTTETIDKYNVSPPGGTLAARSSKTITIDSEDRASLDAIGIVTQRGNMFPVIGAAPETVDFSISVSSPSSVITEGRSTSTTVSITPIGAFTNTVSLTMSGAPSGVSISPLSVTPGSTSTLAVSSSTPVGSYTITITGTSGTLVHSCTYSLMVVAPDFSISVSPSSGETAGSPISATVSVLVVSGSGFTVNLSLYAPAGVSLSPASGTPDFTSTLTVSSSVPAGVYKITIIGTVGALTHVTYYDLTVADFSIVINPSSGNIVYGGSTSAIVSVAQIGPVVFGTVNLTMSGAPSGVSLSPTSGTVYSTFTSTLSVSSSTPVGVYNIIITGSGRQRTHSCTYSLTVSALPPPPSPDFKISADPNFGSVEAGFSLTSTVTLTSQNGFNSPVSLTASGLPSGVTVTFSPNPATPPANGTVTSTLTINTTVSTTPGTYVITITGTGGGKTRSCTFSLSVTPPKYFRVSVFPTSGSVVAGSSLAPKPVITVTSFNGFNTTVKITVTGNPSGVNMSWNMSGTPTFTSTLSISAYDFTVPGVYTLTITAIGWVPPYVGVTHSCTYILTVTAPPKPTMFVQLASEPFIQYNNYPYSVTHVKATARLVIASSGTGIANYPVNATITARRADGSIIYTLFSGTVNTDYNGGVIVIGARQDTSTWGVYGFYATFSWVGDSTYAGTALTSEKLTPVYLN